MGSIPNTRVGCSVTRRLPSRASGSRAGNGEDMVVLENTERVHNMVVCTLCSCYPWPVLGLPPVWYKSAPYRSRAVSEPRSVLGEFGTELPDDVEVRVWTARPSFVIWSCQCDRTAPMAGPKTLSPKS